MTDIFSNASNGDEEFAAIWGPQTAAGARYDAVLGDIGFTLLQLHAMTVAASINAEDVVVGGANAVLLNSGPVTVMIADDLTGTGYLNVECGGSTTVESAVDSTGTRARSARPSRSIRLTRQPAPRCRSRH